MRKNCDKKRLKEGDSVLIYRPQFEKQMAANWTLGYKLTKLRGIDDYKAE